MQVRTEATRNPRREKTIVAGGWKGMESGAERMVAKTAGILAHRIEIDKSSWRRQDLEGGKRIHNRKTVLKTPLPDGCVPVIDIGL